MKQQGNIYTLMVSLLGSAKLIAQGFGYDIISDEQVNLIANGIAAAAAVAGVIINHFQQKQVETEK